MSNTMNLKPFNLELAKQGHPVVTRDGKPVRLFCCDRKPSAYPILGLIEFDDENEMIGEWTLKGGFLINQSGQDPRDLFMAPRKVTKWVNFFQHKQGIQCGCAHDTKETAEKEIGPDSPGSTYLGAFPVEIEL